MTRADPATAEVELTALERTVADAGGDRETTWAGHPDARRRGLVHTPPELARFAARSADEAVRAHLGRRAGLADPGVAIVDPACGPGAFLAAVVAHTATSEPGPVSTARELLGLDRDADALAMAHDHLGRACADLGWPLLLRRRETLESLRPFDAPLSGDDAVVVIGNPPWASRSANRDATETDALLDEFRRDGQGRRLDEGRIGVLSDDYVRFWRWAAEIARQAPGGAVVTLVTNASFVDGPVHRGMRAALLRWFDGLQVVDLGGGTLVARDGSRDENLFRVRPGAVMVTAWRRGERNERASPHAQVRYVALRGSAPMKRARLATTEGDALPWQRLDPAGPHFLLVPRRGSAPSSRTLPTVSLADAMPFHREGIQTNRDAVAIDACPERLLERLHAFARGSLRADLELAWTPKAHYDPQRARRAVRAALEADPEGDRGISVCRIAYRPFDTRWVAPLAPFCHRPRPALRRAMTCSAFALLTVRKDRGSLPWAHFGAATVVPDNCWLSVRSSCRTRAFPTHDPAGVPNLDTRLAASWSQRLGCWVDAPSFASYALAVLAAPAYRAAWDGSFRLDYPRVPVPSCPRTWARLVEVGARLRDLLAAPEVIREAELSPAGPGALAAGGEMQIGHVVLRPAPAELTRALDRADGLVRDGFGLARPSRSAFAS